MTWKDQFGVKGFDSTLRYVERAFKPAEQNRDLVALLKQMGAIIIAKSNLPQSIMVSHPRQHTAIFQLLFGTNTGQWCETENPLWGLTVHPKNTEFTPGGSTGGEGTLLALQLVEAYEFPSIC